MAWTSLQPPDSRRHPVTLLLSGISAQPAKLPSLRDDVSPD
jgi:hypothetical protein